jgi:hypothetical protein
MANNGSLKGIFSGVLSNAVWEAIKMIAAGAAVTSLIQAVIERCRHQSVDWWGIVALALFSALLIGLLLWRDRKINGPEIPTKGNPINGCDDRIHGLKAPNTEEIEGLQTLHKSEVPRATEVRNVAENGERDAIQKLTHLEAQLGLFTNLQLEAFSLAKDIDRFWAVIGPPPAFQSNLQNDTPNGVEKALIDYNARLIPFMERRLHGFQKHFSLRAEALLHGFGERGIKNQSIRLLEVGFSRMEIKEQDNLSRDLRILATRDMEGSEEPRSHSFVDRPSA